jgi:trehalose 6-phosphate synthase
MKYDVIGLQTDGDVQNLVRYLISEMRKARMFKSAGRHVTLRVNGQETLIGSFPVGIEPRAFARLARRNKRSTLVKDLVASLGGRDLVIGVDRLDYSKGLIQRLDAFDIFLANHSEWLGKLTYLQITPANRAEIPEYSELQQVLESAAGRINGKYGEVSWTPIRYVNRVYSRSVLAGLYRMARVGLVTPLRDGMNLVAKEYVAAQDPDDPGVLILSRFAGAAIDFRRALLVNPYDAESVAGAIAQALVMPLEERRARHRVLHAKICEYDVNRWQREFLTVLQGGREPARFRSNASNRELTNLETSGAHLAPIDHLAESQELERGDR